MPGCGAVLVLIENGLRKSAPASVEDEALFFLGRGFPAIFFDGLQDTDRGDIGADLFFGAALAEPVLGSDGVVLCRSLPDRWQGCERGRGYSTSTISAKAISRADIRIWPLLISLASPASIASSSA